MNWYSLDAEEKNDQIDEILDRANFQWVNNKDCGANVTFDEISGFFKFEMLLGRILIFHKTSKNKAVAC